MSLDSLNNLISEVVNKKFFKPTELKGNLIESLVKEVGIDHNKFIEYYSLLEKSNRFEVNVKINSDLEEKLEEVIKIAAEDVFSKNDIPLNNIHSKIQVLETKTIQVPTKFRILKEIN